MNKDITKVGVNQFGINPAELIRIVINIIAPKILRHYKISVRRSSTAIEPGILITEDQIILVVPRNYRNEHNVMVFALNAVMTIMEKIFEKDHVPTQHGLNEEVQGITRFTARSQVLNNVPIADVVMNVFWAQLVAQYGARLASSILAKQPKYDEKGTGQYTPSRFLSITAMNVTAVNRGQEPGASVKTTLANQLSNVLQKLRRAGIPVVATDIAQASQHLAEIVDRSWPITNAYVNEDNSDMVLTPKNVAKAVQQAMNLIWENYPELREDPQEQPPNGGEDEGEGNGQGQGQPNGQGQGNDPNQGGGQSPDQALTKAVSRMGNIPVHYANKEARERLAKAMKNGKGNRFSHMSGTLTFSSENPQGKFLNFDNHPTLGPFKRQIRNMAASQFAVYNLMNERIQGLHNLDVLRGVADPYWVLPGYTNIKGTMDEAPDVVIAVDHSLSMTDEVELDDGVTDGTTHVEACMAIAQAINEVLETMGTHPKFVIFGSTAVCFIGPESYRHMYHGDDWTSVGASAAEFQRGTSFNFVGDLVHVFPRSQIIVITDGESRGPEDMSPQDRERVSLIQIGDDTKGYAAGQTNHRAWVGKVLAAGNLRHLASSIVSQLPVPLYTVEES